MATPSRIRDLAHAALLEVTPAMTVGEHLTEMPRAEQQPGVELVDVAFANTQDGYRGWSWVVTVATVDGEEPTVLELGLLPGDDALLSPEWVPWSVRLAEWQAQQAALAASGEEAEEDGPDGSGDEQDVDPDDDEGDDDEDDDDEDDDDDLSDDPDEEPVGSMREGDIDGVDIDELDEEDDDEDDDSEA